MFLERASTKRIVTEGANKVLWMPLLAEGIDTAGTNGLTATSTNSSSHLVVVLFTIWFTLVFKECTTSKALVTVEAGEVLRMPSLTHGIDEFTTDGLTAASTLERKRRVEATLTECMTIALQETSSKRLKTL